MIDSDAWIGAFLAEFEEKQGVSRAGSESVGDSPAAESDPVTPFVVETPKGTAIPLIVCSPHSGRHYNAAFRKLSRLSLVQLRAGEDFYVDRLIASAPTHGATTLHATFPRVVCDVNRAPLDLDPAMISNGDKIGLRPSERALAGLGSVPRVASGGLPVYSGKLTFDQTAERLLTLWRPYHAALGELIAQARAAHGFCLVLDMHSMPSGLAGAAQFVIGDAFGAASEPIFVESAQRSLQAMQYRVARNRPFSGGFITRHYGRPDDGVSVIQIEISRALYMTRRVHGEWGVAEEFEGKIDALIADMAHSVKRRLSSYQRSAAE
ncbi:N-formylglutamate amidohydrolase [Acetobacter sacchari]|uniref:N-formylglutamate amidohydrolase n=1 Tax=Acetobacter sacchari TaxID=2661687 RepID=A0ABS3LV21_9PROT|nr:N-formylglutamate amidohydrolase [Acetobacter sacchari]MBO1359772.1 N-formylglutamate amidohydrolase [Acetobacter sacchari]